MRIRFTPGKIAGRIALIVLGNPSIRGVTAMTSRFPEVQKLKKLRELTFKPKGELTLDDKEAWFFLAIEFAPEWDDYELEEAWENFSRIGTLH